uniref:Uncharacterized protein n=1 Tax=Avena sativa TaxID=4498 RepID=A0ACD5Y5N9_AVESA
MSPAASASASTIAADSASGHHHLKIEGYSSLKALPNVRRLSSCPFTVGGHRWRIDCYPNGERETSAGHVSVFLALDENVAGKVTTSFRFSFKADKPRLFFGRKNKKATLAPQPSLAAREFASEDGIGLPTFAKWEALEQSRHLKHDSFTIRCDIVVVNGYKVRNAEKPAPNVVRVPPSDLNQHLGGLLLAGKGADVVFEAGGETFAAHRCVLAARSPVFSAELFGSMKEGSTNDLVRIDGMEAQVFKALLCFVYTDSLPEMKKEEEDTMFQHLLVAADMYSMERLKLICEDKLCKYIDVGTVANILALAEAHHCHVLTLFSWPEGKSDGSYGQRWLRASKRKLPLCCEGVVRHALAYLVQGLIVLQMGIHTFYHQRSKVQRLLPEFYVYPSSG